MGSADAETAVHVASAGTTHGKLASTFLNLPDTSVPPLLLRVCAWAQVFEVVWFLLLSAVTYPLASHTTLNFVLVFGPLLLLSMPCYYYVTVSICKAVMAAGEASSRQVLPTTT